ncbi:unnamed protein product [Calypogeia fissa]
MAVADNAGVESMGIGMGIGLNAGIGMGHSLTVTRNYSLPPTDITNNAVENAFESSLLDQQAQRHHPLQQQQQQLHHQQLQEQQQQTQDTAQHGQQSKLLKSPLAPPKQLSSPQQNQQQQLSLVNGVCSRGPEANADGAALDVHSNVRHDSMRELEDLLTKLNPLAKEFVPPSHSDTGSKALSAASSKGSIRRKNGYNNPGKRRANNRTNRAHREDSIRRTVYVSDIDQQVTEEQLAALFITCGQVVDCRVCGDPNSVLRFAFVEFTDEDGARAALSLAGTMLGYYPVRVLPSKTAIVPVNPTFLPRSEDEREMCARTIYCTNIDKKVSQADVKLFFESLCGEVARLRLLGDYHHSTRIAFVEFVMAESAMAALNCSGAILGSLPIRVSPSKTPVRPRSPRPPLH